MNWMQRKEYQRRATVRRGKLIDMLCDSKGLTQTQKDIITLEIMELDIQPDSRAWRWGYKGTLKRARLALEEKMKREA